MKSTLIIWTLLWATTLWSQSMQNLNQTEKVKYIFENLDKNNLHLVTEFYHTDVKFRDPLGEISGAENIKKYYENMYKNVKTIKFDFKEIIEQEKTVIAVWTMTLATDKINDGKPYSVEGNSVVKFDANGMAVYHRDYFDMGEFIYERIPFVGFLVRKVKDRLEFKAD
jgi:ketosteroid isomerase-like protein